MDRPKRRAAVKTSNSANSKTETDTASNQPETKPKQPRALSKKTSQARLVEASIIVLDDSTTTGKSSLATENIVEKPVVVENKKIAKPKTVRKTKSKNTAENDENMLIETTETLNPKNDLKTEIPEEQDDDATEPSLINEHLLFTGKLAIDLDFTGYRPFKLELIVHGI